MPCGRSVKSARWTNQRPICQLLCDMSTHYTKKLYRPYEMACSLHVQVECRPVKGACTAHPNQGCSVSALNYCFDHPRCRLSCWSFFEPTGTLAIFNDKERHGANKRNSTIEGNRKCFARENRTNSVVLRLAPNIGVQVKSPQARHLIIPSPRGLDHQMAGAAPTSVQQL